MTHLVSASTSRPSCSFPSPAAAPSHLPSSTGAAQSAAPSKLGRAIPVSTLSPPGAAPPSEPMCASPSAVDSPAEPRLPPSRALASSSSTAGPLPAAAPGDSAGLQAGSSLAAGAEAPSLAAPSAPASPASKGKKTSREEFSPAAGCSLADGFALAAKRTRRADAVSPTDLAPENTDSWLGEGTSPQKPQRTGEASAGPPHSGASDAGKASDDMGEGSGFGDERGDRGGARLQNGAKSAKTCREPVAAVAKSDDGWGGGAKQEAAGDGVASEATPHPGVRSAGAVGSPTEGESRNGVCGQKPGEEERQGSGREARAESTHPADFCSLCGQPRAEDGRGRAGVKQEPEALNGVSKKADRPAASGGGVAADGDEDDDTWVCETCLRCAEEEAKTEEESLWHKADPNGIPRPEPAGSASPNIEDKGSPEASSAPGSSPATPPTAPSVSSAASASQGAAARSSASAPRSAGGKGGDHETVVASSSGGGKRREAGAGGGGGAGSGAGSASCSGGRGDRSGGGSVPAGARACAAAGAANPAKCIDEGTTRSTTVHVGPNHQVPALPAFFLDSSCWPRPPADTVLDPSLTARLVYSPSALERIKLRREQEGRQDRSISCDADMTAFVKACSQNWKTRPGWQPFSPEFAYKILHYAGYDPVRALHIMNDPQFSFRDVCDPPLRKYDNKWKPKDRRGLIAATPYPPPISARGSLARRHHRDVSGYSLR
ncbi:hypothetical protein BESB_030140 [Besnoitia besnoiti]|uniref:ELM2 domain-containing protein n=1 Tax=Besnoitia besnoiti TaxID=94643 RepID=A0A2A9M6V1_BESBE|nr:hypothetical protein BESB_030140 [Besnoitia besnoiti]PFH31140.1 hypothetical protein BESB_030140 [Besnoitia besnoiti]